MAFTYKVNEKFGEPDLPHFSIGHSLGGAIQFLVAAEDPNNFKGMSLLAPFMALAPETQSLMNKLMLIAKLLNMVAPAYQLNLG